jgi:putative transposase
MNVEPGHRKRMVRREIVGMPRFLTFSCQDRLPLLSNPRIAALTATQIAEARARFRFRLLAWVVMPEHVHLMVIASPDSPEIGRVLEFIKKSVARRVIARWREIDAPILQRLSQGAAGSPRFWQKGGGFDRNVRDTAEMTREITYIHRNPVERVLCAEPTAWAASSARWWATFTGEPGEATMIDGDPPPGNGWERWKGWR